jgi:hypothetical protein
MKLISGIHINKNMRNESVNRTWCLRNQGINTCEGMEVLLHAFLTLAQDVG